jgi:hypothetical protein
MPHSTNKRSGARNQASGAKRKAIEESRYTVGLAPAVAEQVAQYARTADTSMSRAIAALVRLGLEGQESRKREFFRKLKSNLANDDPSQQDQLVDEFRELILGR